MDYISREALYEKTAEWEARALHKVEVTMNDEDLTEWRKWSIILNERSAFKFDVADFPAADVVEVVRCKNCVHQTKFWHKDARRKDGGYFIYGCDYYDGYSQTCLDNDYCSYGERAREEECTE